MTIAHASLSAAASEQPGPTQPRIHRQQLRIHFDFAPYRLASHLLVATALIAVLWQVTSHPRLLAWFAAILVVLAVCALLVRRFHRQPDRHSDRFWMHYVMASGLAVGLLWGAGGVMLFPHDSVIHQLLLLLLLVGLGTGSLSASVYLPQLYSFFPLTMLPVTVVLLIEGGAVHLTAALLVVLFVAMSLYSARAPAQTLLELVRLQIHNDELVAQLQRQKAEAEQANVAKSRFLAAASHDLRQPLHALMLFTSALDRQAKTEALRNIAEHIKTSVGAMEELFDALLDISRLDADALQPEFGHFDLSALAERLKNDFGPAAESKGLALSISGCERVVRSDALLLERILRNLVSNAIRYTDRGEVRVECRRVNQRLRIEISDTGIGIPAERQHEIFGEFFQLGNPERDRNQGLGLGLAIVQRVARLLDHPLELRSAPGAGSCFALSVPLGDAQAVAADATPWADSVLSDLVGLRTLVLDDEREVREGMRVVLEAWGCDVVCSGSEDEALAALGEARRPPDALIVDYRLREGRTGVQAIERLRHEFGRPLPALIVTGDTAAERLREVLASGHQVVHKPLQPAMLRAFLRNVRKQTRAAAS